MLLTMMRARLTKDDVLLSYGLLDISRLNGVHMRPKSPFLQNLRKEDATTSDETTRESGSDDGSSKSL